MKTRFSKTLTLKQRYFLRVIKKSKNKCWGWDGSLSHGYGNMRYNNKSVLAHRLSWQIHRGKIPEGMCVLHKCDNPICTNPQHLFLGTKDDNNKDRDRKGRGFHPSGNKHGRVTKPWDSTGEKNSNSKLSLMDVKEIRKLQKNGRTMASIARDFLVSESCINKIIDGRTWKNE